MMTDLYPSRIRNEPEWLPRQDPVVYSSWSQDAPLSRAQTEAYDRDGYLMVEGLFDADELGALQDELGWLKQNTGDLDPETIVAEPDSRALRSVFAIHAQNQLFERLSADRRLVEIAWSLLGDDVYIHQGRLNCKDGFTGQEFFWHSDFETWHVEDGMPRMRALSMSVQLSDNHAFNGPVLVIPGSHRVFISCVGETPDDHYRQSLKRQQIGTPDCESLACLADRHGIDIPTGPAGSVLIFDCNLIHGSNSNITPFPRSNAFMVYNAMSNELTAPFGARRPRPQFIANRNDVRPVDPQGGHLLDQVRAA